MLFPLVASSTDSFEATSLPQPRGQEWERRSVFTIFTTCSLEVVEVYEDGTGLLGMYQLVENPLLLQRWERLTIMVRELVKYLSAILEKNVLTSLFNATQAGTKTSGLNLMSIMLPYPHRTSPTTSPNLPSNKTGGAKHLNLLVVTLKSKPSAHSSLSSPRS
jgi:hypothetical protein